MGNNVTYTASTHELAGKRITLSYIPATSADETLIAYYGGFLYDVPAYMLNLKPVLRVEGVIKATGDVVNLGSEQNLTFQYFQPSGVNEAINKKLFAGAYYAMAMNLQGINENVLGKRNYQLNTNVLSETAGTLGTDDLIGEHLFILATTYHLANDKIYKAVAKLYNTVAMRTLSEGITSFTVTVSHIFGMPKSAMPSGVNMDVAMDRVIAVAKDGDTSKEKSYMGISGLVSSYHEHDIFEKIDKFASTSAVRVLQVAAGNNIPIKLINATNIGEILPTLQVGPEIKADIQNAVNAGKEVTIPQSNVQINDWSGVGYIVKDTVTGAGAYMISGGLAGSDNTKKQDGMRVVEIHKEPLGFVKNNIDPQVRSTIAMAAAADVGEFAGGASGVMTGLPYDDVDCAHLVRLSYWAAGICLDYNPALPLSGCTYKNSLTGRHKIGPKNGNGDWLNGATLYHELADHLKAYDGKGVRDSNDPLIGDIVFFNYGSGSAHVGIVISSPDDEESIAIIDSSGHRGYPSRGVDYRIMNIKKKDCAHNYPPLTARSKADPEAPACCVNCTAASWFEGFGTVRDVSCSDNTHK
jgi:hypothetical protein